MSQLRDTLDLRPLCWRKSRARSLELYHEQHAARQHDEAIRPPSVSRAIELARLRSWPEFLDLTARAFFDRRFFDYPALHGPPFVFEYEHQLQCRPGVAE